MVEQKVDHLLMSGFDNIRYATDYRTQIIGESFDWFAAVVNADGGAELFVPWVDERQDEPLHDLPNIRAVHPLPSWTPAVPQAGYWARTIASRLDGAR